MSQSAEFLSNSVEVPLSCGRVTLLDREDLSLLEGRRWWAARRRNGAYYAATHINRRTVFLHRVILSPPPGLVVDHISGQTLDNRRSNLRACTHQQNLCNRKPSKRAHFGLKGIEPTPSGRWAARIKAGTVRAYVGTFDDPISAALAYDEAARALHGAFALVNFPEGAPQ